MIEPLKLIESKILKKKGKEGADVARKSRRQKRKKPRVKKGHVIVNKKDYTRRDYISPGKLVAWAEWVEDDEGESEGKKSG